MRSQLLCFLLAAAAFAQHQHPQSAEKRVALLSGLGTHKHPIATRSPEAQKFFDQGLALLYGFNRYEALRSFRRAAELDSKAVMPRWGMAMAQGPHVNMDVDGDVQMKNSCDAVRDGMELRAGAPEHEQAYIEAVAKRCPAYKPREYSDAMRDLVKRFPDDLDAATLLAESLMIPVRWRWWNRDGTPADGVEEAVRILEATLRRDPEHPGANHFFIHAVEMSPSPERAIPSAQRLMGIVPAAGHLVHMPGHIWLLLGEWELAASTNERAAEVDRRYMAETGVSESSYVGYYIHNLHFVAVARAMQGRMDDATRAADALASATAPFAGQMPMMVDVFVPAPLFAMLRFQRWDDILKASRPDEKLLASTALWHFARAAALAAKQRRDDALEEQLSFEAARKKVPPEWLWLNNKASDVLNLAAAVLNARLAESDKAAIPHWRSAVELQDALVYDEPPPWYYPVRESLGSALLRAGDAAGSETVFREGVQRSPRNGRMLFGLREALKAQGKTSAVELVGREFESAWKRADITLSLSNL
jgi:tetratricopeptide (TPR) repeat protein